MRKTITLIFSIILAFGAFAFAAETIKMHGATTPIDFIINPYKATVEKSTGYTLEVVGNNAGRGMLGLADGLCDICMTAGDIKTSLEAAKKAGRELNAADFTWIFLQNDEIVFAVNPKNPVNTLTYEQMKDIYTGKIKNWKEVGGKDLPILLFSHNTTSATRALIQNKVLKGEEYSPEVQAQTSQNLINAKVAANPGGFSAISKMNTSSKVKLLDAAPIIRPLAFITKGEPEGKIKIVIAAFKAEIAKTEKPLK